MAKISAIVHTYNAEKHLSKVLDSLRNFDEILVCDMESTDSTLTIAKEHNCRIITFPKANHKCAEPARGTAIKEATNDWILEVDADELIPDSLREYLYDVTERENAPNGVMIPRKNFFMGKFMACYYPDYILRFFKKENVYWAPMVHSQPVVEGTVIFIPKKRDDLAMIHLANDTFSDIIRKMDNYTEYEKVRRAKKYSFIKVFYAPFFRFFKTYVLKGGFRAGKIGFIHAVADGYYRFSSLAKIEEDIQNKKQNKDIDKYL